MGKNIESLLLLSCRSPYLDSDKIYPPLGNLYLHSVIKKNMPHVDVRIRDDYDLINPDWINGHDVIGLSIMTPQRSEANRLLHFIKDKRPKVKVIAGGPHARYYLEDMLNEPWDNICTHDGERAIT